MMRWRWILPVVQVAFAVVLLARLQAENEAAHRIAVARGGWDVQSCWDCPPPLPVDILLLLDFPALVLSAPLGALGDRFQVVQWSACLAATAGFWFWAGRRTDWLRARRKIASPGRAATVFFAVATLACSFGVLAVCWSVLHGSPWGLLRAALTCVWPLAFAVFFGSRCVAGTRAWRKSVTKAQPGASI
jgi:hypothetical protein